MVSFTKKVATFLLAHAVCVSSAAGYTVSTLFQTETMDTGDGQGTNEPALFTLYNNAVGPVTASATSSLVMKTKSDSAKFYVRCRDNPAGGHIDQGATYSLYYTLDNAASKLLDNDFVLASNPFILIEELDDGAHKLTVSCVVNGLSYMGNTLPTTSLIETDPLVFNWIVDTDTTPDLDKVTEPAEYTSLTSLTFSVKTDRADDVYNNNVWECSVDSGAFAVCGGTFSGTDSDTITIPYDSTALADGSHTYEVRQTATAQTAAQARSDLATATVSKKFTWHKDTAPPTLVITSSPANKAKYYEGKTVKFEFACGAGEHSCTYMCSVDGKNSVDPTSSSSSSGYFSCTSPLTIEVTNSTTHGFKAYAVDAASNESPRSPIYTFYADGTSPKVYFSGMDPDTMSATAQLSTGLYYSNDMTTTTTGGAITFSAGSDPLVNGGGDTDHFPAASVTDTTWATVFQFKYAPSTAVYELADGYYGAILGSKKVNDKWYLNVVDTTNADNGRLNYYCSHPEFA